MCQLRDQVVRAPHTCWYCGREFRTYGACVQHMVDKYHCKLPDEVMGTSPEISAFYSFAGSDATAVDTSAGGDFQLVPPPVVEAPPFFVDVPPERVDDEDAITGAAAETAVDGSLVLPDGRVLGHRNNARYYRQTQRPQATTAVASADSEGNASPQTEREREREREIDGEREGQGGSEESGTLLAGGKGWSGAGSLHAVTSVTVPAVAAATMKENVKRAQKTEQRRRSKHEAKQARSAPPLTTSAAF